MTDKTFSSRIENKFSQLKQNNRKGLVCFLSAGDPNFETSLSLINEIAKELCDILEIGMPFSDPMADGNTIQLASIRAIKAKQTMNKTLKIVENVRNNNPNLPILLMGYINPIMAFGVEKFLSQARKVGVDGLIIVDLPPEEDDTLCIKAIEHGLEWIRLVTPTTSEKRLTEKILPKSSGFIYCVSTSGITGTQQPNTDIVTKQINMIKKHSKLPIAVGFGINNPTLAKTLAKDSDAIVVGSAIVKIIQDSIDQNYNCINQNFLISKTLKMLKSIKNVL